MLLMCVSSEDYISYFSYFNAKLIMSGFGVFWLLLMGVVVNVMFSKHIKVALFLKSAEVYLNPQADKHRWLQY